MVELEHFCSSILSVLLVDFFSISCLIWRIFKSGMQCNLVNLKNLRLRLKLTY